MNIDIVVDKRTELLGVLLLISDYNKKFPRLIEECGNKEYREKIFNSFSKFKKERAVLLLNDIIAKLNFNYDAPVSLFLQLNEDFTYQNLDIYPFYSRLKQAEIVKEFLNELPNFVKTIKFDDFYASNEAFYKQIIKETKEKTNINQVVDFINTFYKKDISNVEFTINLLPYTTNGNFGTNHDNKIYSNLGLKRYQKQPLTFMVDNNHGTLILHEFSHSIVNPLTAKYSNIMYDEFGDIKEAMKKMAYGDASTIINEHVIRAIEVFYLKEKYKKDLLLSQSKLDMEKSLGFKYIEVCLQSIEVYFKNIKQYKDFEEYYPNIIKSLKESIVDNSLIL